MDPDLNLESLELDQKVMDTFIEPTEATFFFVFEETVTKTAKSGEVDNKPCPPKNNQISLYNKLELQ